MRIRNIVSVLLALIMLLPVQVFAIDSEGDQYNEWSAADFIYDSIDVRTCFLSPATNIGDKLEGNIYVVTGLSESGEEKINENTDIVIPEMDPDGNRVQGVGPSAFSGRGITSVDLPDGIFTDNNGKWDPFVKKRGDFFVCSSAFSSNEIEALDLPEGVLYVGGNAFKNNKLTRVSFPKTIMLIANGAFGDNEISELVFPDETDFPLQLDNMSFAINKITEVTLPERTEKVTKWAFFQNTGMEPVVNGTENEKAGGIVYFYIKDPGRYIEDTVTGKSNVQKMIAEYSITPEDGEDEEEGDDEPDSNQWTTNDFTFGEYEKRLYGCDYSRDFTIKGIAVTGLSELGENKLKENKNIVIPAKDNEGKTIIGVAPGAFKNKGLESVKFPSGMLVNYNDTVTYRITKRGNFVIGENAFSGNNLTSVNLPDGVIAVLGQAFSNNKLTTVTLPKTIWWLETYSFGKNQINKVNFPETTYFAFEMHGWPFADNRIKSVRLPDCTAVVNKYSFQQNPGMKKLTDDELRQAYRTPVFADTVDEQIQILKDADQDGIVYMYADVIEMADLDRIHHYDKSTGSTHSWFQKLIINDGTPETQNPDGESWNIKDFTVKGTTITGLSASGEAKRKINKNLVIPDYNANSDLITEIAAASPTKTGGLFATAEEKLDSVSLPSGLLKIGDNAFRESGISEVAFPPELQEIGESAFQMNSLTAVVLPDTVKKLGKGAFASNKTIEKIILSSGLKEIPDGAFGCSDGKNWMKGLTEIEIPYGITKISSRAFAGNNFHKIVVPEGVTEIGNYAFSTKNYLLLDDDTECEVVLPDTLKTIGDRAFRNKKIATIDIPKSVGALGKNTFEKVLSTYGTPDIPGSMVYALTTQVNLRSKAQYEDKTKFPESKFHEIKLTGFEAWDDEDFTYEVTGKRSEPVCLVTGLSERGEVKIADNKELAIPDKDKSGNAITGIGASAFSEIGLTNLQIPEGIKCIDENAFSGNNINELSLPEGVETIGDNAFRGNSIAVVDFPDSISRIGASSFADNTISGLRFTDQTILPLVIEENAFSNNAIKAVQLPAKTSKVAANAFASNKGKGGIVYLYVIEPGDEIFNIDEGTSSVQKLVSNESMPAEDVWQLDDFEYSSSGDTILGFSEYGLERFDITHDVILPDKSPDGTVITQIASNAFKVDESDIDVGKYDYGTTNGITTVVLPKNLKQIGDYAFEYNSLEEIDFSECKSIEKIGVSAFHGNKLVSLSLPDTITELGGGAFSANNLHQLKLSKGLTEIPQGAFSMNIRLSHVDIPNTVTQIGQMAFAGARLTSLTIPTSVIKIDRKAFHLHHLKSLTIPGTVKEIGESAFEGTYKAQTLKSLELGEGIEIIGKCAFKEGLLTRVKLPNSLKSMGYEPFINNTGEGKGHVVILPSYNKDHFAFNEGARYHRVVDQAEIDAQEAAEAKRRADEEARKKAASEEAKARSIKVVTVNNKVVTSKAVDAAVKKAGGSKKYVTTIVLGKKVKKIKKGSFTGYDKVKTLQIKTKKLKKSSVKGSLKGSKITKIKIIVGKKTTNKKIAKKYRKVFTKKNAGKKVKIVS